VLTAFARLKAANSGAITVLNTAPTDHLTGKLPQLDLRHVDYWVLNWHEWATLIHPEVPPTSHEMPGLKRGLQTLQARTGVPHICLTLGEKGCLWHTPEQTLYAPAFQVVTKNPVGAGDTFVAALISHLLAQQPLPASLRYASAAAACACLDAVAIGEHVAPETITALLAEQGAAWDENFRVL
jgi:sugar/nucleoside kinase (ribokinase family)